MTLLEHKKPPMTSWNGTEDLESFKQLQKLEKFFGGDHAIVVNTKQTAVQLCLEVLGTRSHMLPVAVPVTASLEVFTGVLWSGAVPVVLDIDMDTQQVQLEDLQELLGDDEGAVVVLDRCGGYPTPTSVLEAVQNVPTIAVSRNPPNSSLEKTHLTATFNIFDLSEVIGTGAVIFHKFQVQQKELRMLRGGPLGHKAWLTEDLCSIALKRLKYGAEYRQKVHNKVQKAFSKELKDRECSNILLWDLQSSFIGPIYFNVPNAPRMLAHLQSYEIPCRGAFYPLHKIPEVARRMLDKDDADYGVSEILHSHTITLPSYPGMLLKVPFTVDKMMELGEAK